MARFSESGFGIRDLNKPNHWNSDVSRFRITKPTFICLGGNGIIDSKKANGQASRNERLMGLKPEEGKTVATYKNFDIISFYYGRNDEEETAGSVSNEESITIIKQLFLPLVVDEASGERFPFEIACRNFSKLIFSSHCYGSEVVNNLMYDLKQMMKKYGYKESEIEMIYSHAFHLSYSPYKADSFLPFMQINSLSDSFNDQFDMKTWFKNKFGYMLNGVKLVLDKKYFFNYIANDCIKPFQQEISLYTSRLVNTDQNVGSTVVDEHSSTYVDLSQDWGACEAAEQAKNSECVSKIAGYTLASAGARAYNISAGYFAVEPVCLENIIFDCKDILESFNQEDLQMK